MSRRRYQSRTAAEGALRRAEARQWAARDDCEYIRSEIERLGGSGVPHNDRPRSRRPLGAFDPVQRSVVETYRETGSIYRTAERLGKSKSAVHKILIRAQEPVIGTSGAPRADLSRAAEAFARWRDGETYQQIADDFGVTREAVRLWIERAEPHWLHGLVKDLHATRRRRRAQLRAAEEQAGRPWAFCPACGAPTQRSPHPPHDVATCSGECSRIWLDLRFHVSDLHREEQRFRIATRNLDAGTPTVQRHAARALAGQARTRGRWLTATSSKWASALTAYERRLPIFDQLPAEIQEQVRARADMANSAA